MIRKRPTHKHPYGLHRAMGIGHLVAGVALLVIGGNLAIESVISLIKGEHPTIGTVNLFGYTIWLGWLMVTVMSVIIIGPFIYGPAKAKLAPKLHNKVLFADADMAKADWTTNVASIVGVLGVGLGVWWLDGAAALFISIGIAWDGFKNCRSADSRPHGPAGAHARRQGAASAARRDRAAARSAAVGRIGSRADAGHGTGLPRRGVRRAAPP